jgi:hypothetical protein
LFLKPWFHGLVHIPKLIAGFNGILGYALEKRIYLSQQPKPEDAWSSPSLKFASWQQALEMIYSPARVGEKFKA